MLYINTVSAYISMDDFNPILIQYYQQNHNHKDNR